MAEGVKAEFFLQKKENQRKNSVKWKSKMYSTNLCSNFFFWKLYSFSFNLLTKATCYKANAIFILLKPNIFKGKMLKRSIIRMYMLMMTETLMRMILERMMKEVWIRSYDIYDNNICRARFLRFIFKFLLFVFAAYKIIQKN